MSSTSNSKSKLVAKTKSLTDQLENLEDEIAEKKDEEMESTTLMEEALLTTPTVTVIRRYKMPYRNFLRDFKIQMQNENLPNQEIMKIASQRWKTMTYAEKEPYIHEAAYVKEVDAQNKRNNYHQCTRQVPTKRKKKCPKCGGYPASSSPSEQSTNETPTESGTVEETGESENNQDYSSDTSYSSTETKASAGSAEHDAPKKCTRRQKKKRTKRAQKNVKRRKQETSSSGSASYCANSSDNSKSITSDTAVRSNISNYTSASI